MSSHLERFLSACAKEIETRYTNNGGSLAHVQIARAVLDTLYQELKIDPGLLDEERWLMLCSVFRSATASSHSKQDTGMRRLTINWPEGINKTSLAIFGIHQVCDGVGLVAKEKELMFEYLAKLMQLKAS